MYPNPPKYASAAGFFEGIGTMTSKPATGMVVVPPRMCLVTPSFIDDLAEDLRAALPGYQFQIVPDYIGRQSHEFVVEPDGWVPDEAVEELRAVLARYGDKAGQ